MLLCLNKRYRGMTLISYVVIPIPVADAMSTYVKVRMPIDRMNSVGFSTLRKWVYFPDLQDAYIYGAPKTSEYALSTRANVSELDIDMMHYSF